MGGRTTCWPFGAVYAPKERSSEFAPIIDQDTARRPRLRA